jgi:LuxR family maltose regulon positive regulatory protein
MKRSQPTTPIQRWGPTPAAPSFPILESKLTPAPTRPGLISRIRLLDRLEASAATPVVVISAPAGYGKTVLAAEWAQRDQRPFVWLSIDRHDNDPAVLLTYLAVGLDRVEPIDPAVFRALASRAASIAHTVLPPLATALSSKALPVVVVLDDVQLLHDQEGLDALAVLVDHLPQGSQLVVISRAAPLLPVARWRVEGRLAELGRDELAMDPVEAGSLLRAARVELADGEVAELHRRTEGWPAALYLAALSLKAQRRTAAGVEFSGRERFLVDYLQSTLLAALSPTQVQFLTRTAVLERLSGPLCDAVLGTTGSAAVLASLERANLLVVPLDRQRDWYRYHPLFRELLRGELERAEPELVGELARRAAKWCADHGLAEAAVDYAMDAGDADLVARGVEQAAIGVYRSGRLATVQRWFDWFDDQGLIQQYPAVAVLGAWVQALGGHAAAAERWADAAEQGSYEGRLPDGSSIDGWRALLRAKLCRHGVSQMRTDAELALTLIPVGSLWRAPAQLLAGISRLLAGDLGAADAALAEAVEVAQDTGATLAASAALAERALLAIGRQDWQDAEALVEQARSVVGTAHLEDCATSIVLYAVAARVAIHHGNIGQADQDLARSQRLRPQATHALPYYAVQARLELVCAYLTLTDVAATQTVFREVDDLLRWRPDLGILRDQANQFRAQLDHIRGDLIGMTSLTTAELRLFPLLATHLTYREMGQQLHLSQHTVKSQAMSIYRKLGVSTRGQAVQRVQEIGLLAR